MKRLVLNKNTGALILAAVITFGFFCAGLFGILDYFIVKMLLFTGISVLFFAAVWTTLKRELKKNRLDDVHQDDLR